MQMISIEYILESMASEKNYFGDIWENCLNNNKRFNRAKLKEILKERGYKRINDKGNWLEIKTPKRGPSRYGDQSFDLRDLVRKVLQNQITLDNVNPDDKNKIELINWKNKVTQDGFDIKISGGDHQAIFQLKRQ